MKKLKFILTRLLPPVITTLLWRMLRTSPYRAKRVAKSTPELAGGAAILEGAWSHLDATASLSKTPFGIPASKRWTALLERMRHDIGSFNSAQEAIHFAQTGTDFENRAPVNATAHLFQLHAETLKSQFPHL